jgi:uncharacterized membrane protein
MQQPSFAKKMLPLFFLFVLVNSLVLYFQKELDDKKIDALVVFAANCLLFVLSVLSLAMHTKAPDKKNPNAIVRGVMAATLLKMMVLGASALVYLFLSGPNRSINAIFAGLVLYVIYTFIEVGIASKNNDNNNAGK